jgi:hypothetical protein
MNNESSRSHSVFTFVIESRSKVTVLSQATALIGIAAFVYNILAIVVYDDLHIVVYYNFGAECSRGCK